MLTIAIGVALGVVGAAYALGFLSAWQEHRELRKVQRRFRKLDDANPLQAAVMAAVDDGVPQWKAYNDLVAGRVPTMPAERQSFAVLAAQGRSEIERRVRADGISF